MHFIVNLLLSPPVKAFSKSDNVWRNYEQCIVSCFFFDSRCIMQLNCIDEDDNKTLFCFSIPALTRSRRFFYADDICCAFQCVNFAEITAFEPDMGSNERLSVRLLLLQYCNYCNCDIFSVLLKLLQFSYPLVS